MATNNAINQLKPFPLFFAYLNASAGSVTGDGTNITVPYNTVVFNDGSFNTGTYTMTAPVTGIYILNASALLDNCNGKTSFTFNMLTAGNNQVSTCSPNTATSGTQYSMNSTLIVKLTAAQTVYVALGVGGGAKNCSVISAGATDPRSWFSATLIG